MKVPFAEMDRLSPPLFWSTSPVPARPETVPPTVDAPVTQVTATFVTFPLPTVPLPFVTVHVCAGEVGWVRTVTT